MAFEENDAPNATPSPGNDVGALPTNAPAAPPIPVSPTGAPAAQPAQPAAKISSPMGASQEQPEAPGSHFKNLSHSLKGAVLAVLAGPQQVVDHYETDDSGKPMKAVMRHLHPNERLQLMAQAALTGLAAGSRIPPQKSKGAAWGAGIGAGAEAQIGQAQQQDLLKRQQSQEDYDRQQKAQVHKATIAATNATTHSTWQKIGDDENARDAERQKNTGIVNALNDFTAQNPQSKLTVQTLTEEQALAMREADSHTVAKHTFLPVGRVQAKDANGNDVFEADGVTPKFTKQFAAISGSADEKIPLPQAMVDDLKKYAKFDPRLKSFADVPAGTLVPFTGFLTAYKYSTEDKGREADGWREAKPGENAASVDGKTVQHNPFTGDTREYIGGVPLSVQKEQADIEEKKAGAFEKTELGKKAKKDADALPVSNLTGDDYLKTLPTPQQTTVRAIGEGRRLVTGGRKEALALMEQVHQAYPDYDEAKAKTWQHTRNEYMGSGTTAKKVVSYNAALEHMKDLYEHSTFQGLYAPGSKDYSDRSVALNYVSNEVGNAIKTGVMSEKEGSEILDSLKGWTPGTSKERTAETARLLHDKIGEYQTKFSEGAPSSAVQVPILLSPRAAAAYDYVQSGGKVSQPSSQPGPQGGQNFPAGATHIVPGPDGKNHYTNADGTKDYGVVQ